MNIYIILITILAILFANLFLIFVMVIKQRTKPQFILPWVFIMILLPILGFFLYLFYGLSLNSKIKKNIKNKKKFSYEFVEKNANSSENDINTFVKNLQGSNIYQTKTQIFTHSFDKIKSLKKDIQNAKKSINIEYYIFQNDKIGREIMYLLCQKASQGVKVNLIYDAVGSKKSPKRFFKKLKKYGGQVKCFFPAFLNISFLNPRYNYRNHKKIVVIDGRIGYFGGMNICLDKVNNKKPRPWKDIHYRVEGEIVNFLQSIFFADLMFLKGKIDDYSLYYNNSKVLNYNLNLSQLQILASGPDEKMEKSEALIIKAMSKAQKSVYIQSPYFVPNDSFLLALKQACLSGIKVIIMLPGKQDRKILQKVALYYISKLKDYNIKFFLYDGFLHSKLLVVDDDLAVCGSANYDNRSFSLNFELSGVFYDFNTVKKLKNVIMQDIQNSQQITQEFLKNNKADSPFNSILSEIISPFL